MTDTGQIEIIDDPVGPGLDEAGRAALWKWYEDFSARCDRIVLQPPPRAMKGSVYAETLIMRGRDGRSFFVSTPWHEDNLLEELYGRAGDH